jgi:hypothetical protein
MAAAYSKMFLPLSQVKEKEFLLRSRACKGVGLQLSPLQVRRGATYVHHKVAGRGIYLSLQETGSIIFHGKRISMPEGTMVRVAPKVDRALGNDSDKEVIYMILGAVPQKELPTGNRTLLGDGIPNRKKVPRWKKQ